MGAFDPNQFLDASMDAPLERRPPIPVGDYIGMLGEPESIPWVGKTDPTKSGFKIEYPVEIEVPVDIKERLGLTANIKSKYSVMLDLNEQGTMSTAPGANGGIRRLREALDLNKPGDRWNARMAAGRTAKFKIGHREYPEGSGELFEDIVGIAKA